MSLVQLRQLPSLARTRLSRDVLGEITKPLETARPRGAASLLSAYFNHKETTSSKGTQDERSEADVGRPCRSFCTCRSPWTRLRSTSSPNLVNTRGRRLHMCPLLFEHAKTFRIELTDAGSFPIIVNTLYPLRLYFPLRPNLPTATNHPYRLRPYLSIATTRTQRDQPFPRVNPCIQ